MFPNFESSGYKVVIAKKNWNWVNIDVGLFRTNINIALYHIDTTLAVIA